MKTIVGIDLGTTNSAVAFMDGDEPHVIPNERGNRITPSVVAFTESGDVLVGESAKNQAIVNAGRTITAVKRTMGSSTAFEIGSRSYRPEEISGFILGALRRQAEEYLGTAVQDAVITVPAHFSEAQRRATQEAGRLAGLRVARILNEPTAAALAYAYKTPGDRRILVYDLGGGTFDVTCLEKQGRDFRVLATEGDNRLGGVDFDRLLLDRVVEKFEKDSGIDVRSEPVLMQQLAGLAEQAKIELSTRENAQIALPFLGGAGDFRGRPGPLHLSYAINRELFNELIEGLVQRTVKLTMKAVKSAGFGIRGVDSLVLSGGCSRIPLVSNYLKRALNLEKVALVNPDEMVALGAAVQAGILAGEARSSEKIEVHDVMPYNLGVEIEGDQFVTVLPRNSAIPAESQRTFTTVSDDQTSVEIHVLQGDRRAASENASLGRFLLSGVRRGKQGEPRVRVLFTVDIDGLVWVSARDVDTGAEQEISVTPVRSERTSDGRPGRSFDVRKRVGALSKRLVELSDRERKRIDAGFAAEIEELLALSGRALKRDDERSLHECHLALETIIGELHVTMRTVDGGDDRR